MNREAIYSALFAKVSTAANFTTISRRLKHWADVPAVDQPALFQAQVREIAEPQTQVLGQPTRWKLSVDLYVYATCESSGTPSAVLNPLIDSIVAALAPSNPIEKTQTLGGLVLNAWIEGTIETDEGTLGNQAVAIIPISITAT